MAFWGLRNILMRKILTRASRTSITRSTIGERLSVCVSYLGLIVIVLALLLQYILLEDTASDGCQEALRIRRHARRKHRQGQVNTDSYGAF